MMKDERKGDIQDVILFEIPWPPLPEEYWSAGHIPALLSRASSSLAFEYLQELNRRFPYSGYSKGCPYPYTGRISVQAYLSPPNDAIIDNLESVLKVPLDAFRRVGLYVSEDQIFEVKVNNELYPNNYANIQIAFKNNRGVANDE